MAVRSAKSQMALNSGSFQSDYTRNEYQEAKEKHDKATAELEELTTKGKNLYEKITTKLKSNPELIGYKAFHNFRADDNAGNTFIGNIIALFDKDMEHVTYVFEMEEYEELQKYIEENILKKD